MSSIHVTIRYELPSKAKITGDAYDLLIVSALGFSDAVQPLVAHKENRGIRTLLVTLDDIYTGSYFAVHGRDNAEKIKYFIKDAVEHWGIQYVMLVGGHEQLPVRYSYLNDRSASWERERRFISDLYYADIYDSTGNFSSWDSNGNGYYGEYDHETPDGKMTDKIDLYPDVYIGRLACRNNREVNAVVDKIAQYENDDEKAYFNTMVMCGGDLYPNDPCGNIAEGIYLEEAIAGEMAGFNIIRQYPSSGMNMFTISRAINQGAGFVVFEGAGAHHLWATHPYDEEKWIYYYDHNIRLLNNGDALPIVLTSGARLGQFNQSRECFNWAFVAKKGGGAVASIGSTGLCWIGHGTNVTSFYLGNLHLRLFQEYHDTDVLGKVIGDAIRKYLHACGIGHHGVSESFYIKAAEELELFGDPTLSIGDTKEQKTGQKPLLRNEGYSSDKDTLYVGGSGEGNYTSIQDAIDDARNGYRIFVYNGVYPEQLKINKSISIVGQSGESVILKSDGNGIEVKTGGVTVATISISSSGSGKNAAGIVCSGGGNAFHNVTISGYDWGIYMENAPETIVEKSRLVKNNEYAIYMIHSPGSVIRDNRIHDNWYGMWAEYSPHLSIEGNNFSSSRWYALWLDNAERSTIESNTFLKNWYSIYLYLSGNNTISENNIYRNEHGPQFVDAKNNTFIHNVVQKNEHYGIAVGSRSGGNVFTGNDIIRNAQNVWDNYGSSWDHNYWSDYVGLKIRLLGVIGVPYHVPGKPGTLDRHPSMVQLN